MANGEPPIGIPWETFQNIREVNMLLYEKKGVIFMTLRIKIIIAELIRKVCCISPKWGNRVMDILGYDNYCRVAKYWKVK